VESLNLDNSSLECSQTYSSVHCSFQQKQLGLRSWTLNPNPFVIQRIDLGHIDIDTHWRLGQALKVAKACSSVPFVALGHKSLEISRLVGMRA
jgi:hypothetical protein